MLTITMHTMVSVTTISMITNQVTTNTMVLVTIRSLASLTRFVIKQLGNDKHHTNFRHHKQNHKYARNANGGYGGAHNIKNLGNKHNSYGGAHGYGNSHNYGGAYNAKHVGNNHGGYGGAHNYAGKGGGYRGHH